jgi:hypothetical protein
MTDETQVEGGAAAEGAKGWRPSRRPSHHGGPAALAAEGRIVEQQENVGFLGALARFLKRPFVKLVIGLGIFVLGAIVYDATVNFGEWTERKEKPKATKHRGLAPIQQTPDG